MRRIWAVFIAVPLLVLACSFTDNMLATPTPTAAEPISYSDCPSTQPTKEDIDLVLKHDAEFFPSPDWKNSYTVMEYQVSVAWKNDKLSALVNFDRVIFCGATNTALDDYYTDATFDIIFQNYDGGHAAQKDCRSHDLRLYEYKLKNRGSDYNAKFWVEILDGNHIQQSLLVFPIANVADFDSYSKKIMPKLSSCE